MVNRSTITPGDGDPRHGTANGYNNLGCRGPDCTAAVRAQRAAWRARQEPPPPDDPRHGTAHCYTNLGCRCKPCRRAYADARAARARGADR